jgi:hypothetical protein
LELKWWLPACPLHTCHQDFQLGKRPFFYKNI